MARLRGPTLSPPWRGGAAPPFFFFLWGRGPPPPPPGGALAAALVSLGGHPSTPPAGGSTPCAPEHWSQPDEACESLASVYQTKRRAHRPPTCRRTSWARRQLLPLAG